MLRGIVNSATGKEATIEEISSAVAVQSDDVDSMIRQKMALPATVTHTNTDPASLNTAIQALVDGDVLEVNSAAIYNPISIPANKSLVIRSVVGKSIHLTGTECIKLMNGARDTFIADIAIKDSTTVNGNYMGAGITFGEPSIEQLREQAELKAYSIRDIAMQAGFVYGEITIDTSLKAREIMSFAYAKAVENPEHVFNMILKDGTKVEITGADFVNIYQAMVTYGEALYNQCVQNIETIKTAEASQLKKFIKDGVWE